MRKKYGDKLERVISSNVSLVDFQFLERYAKIMYNDNFLRQPTISNLVRYVIKKWIITKQKEEGTYFSPFQGDPENILRRID